ncbi:endonuclease, partial [Streptomyces sp. NPDC058954]
MRRLFACLAAATAALGGLTAAAPSAAAADSGSFSVLSYNVAGLPE